MRGLSRLRLLRAFLGALGTTRGEDLGDGRGCLTAVARAMIVWPVAGSTPSSAPVVGGAGEKLVDEFVRQLVRATSGGTFARDPVGLSM